MAGLWTGPDTQGFLPVGEYKEFAVTTTALSSIKNRALYYEAK